METAGLIAASVSLVLAMLCLMGLLVAFRQIGLLHKRLPPVGAKMGPIGPLVNTPAPQFDTLDDAGAPLRIGGKKDRSTVLAFVSPACDGCKSLAPALASLARSEGSTFEVILAGIDEKPIGGFAIEQGLSGARFVSGSSLALSFEVSSSPFVFVIDPDGVVRAKGLANHLDHLDSLLHAAEFERARHHAGVGVSSSRPALDVVPSVEEVLHERV